MVEDKPIMIPPLRSIFKAIGQLKMFGEVKQDCDVRELRLWCPLTDPLRQLCSPFLSSTEPNSLERIWKIALLSC